MAAQRAAKNVFTTVTDSVFPGSSRLIDGDKNIYFERGNELISNLPLQMALYFNLHFAPFWLATCVLMLVLKYNELGPYYKFILIVVYIIMAGIEITRLYLGWSGNLQEKNTACFVFCFLLLLPGRWIFYSQNLKVPELAGFWLVTFILQLPLTCFLLFNEKAKVLATERAVHIIMLMFLLVEVFQGYRTIKRMTDAQVQKFQLRQFNEPIEMESIGGERLVENFNAKKVN